MNRRTTILTILIVLMHAVLFAQNDCVKCDIEKVITVSENHGNLTFQIIEDFLCTFADSCEINVEYSEWSNEVLYELLENEPEMVINVLESGENKISKTVLNEIENPVYDFDLQKIYEKVSAIKNQGSLKGEILKSLVLAADKEGIEIK
jgi:hypothetical protein